MSRRRITITSLPAVAREGLARDTHDGRSVNDAAAAIIARHYNITYAATGRQPRRAHIDGTVILKLPEPLWQALREDATYSLRTMAGTAAYLLTTHYTKEQHDQLHRAQA